MASGDARRPLAAAAGAAITPQPAGQGRGAMERAWTRCTVLAVVALLAANNQCRAEDGDNHADESCEAPPVEASIAEGHGDLADEHAGFAAGPGDLAAIEREIRSIVQSHAPEKVGNVVSELERWSGREDRLLQLVKEKYGVGGVEEDFGHVPFHRGAGVDLAQVHSDGEQDFQQEEEDDGAVVAFAPVYDGTGDPDHYDDDGPMGDDGEDGLVEDLDDEITEPEGVASWQPEQVYDWIRTVETIPARQRQMIQQAVWNGVIFDGYPLELDGNEFATIGEGALRKLLFPTQSEQNGWYGSSRVPVLPGRKPPTLPSRQMMEELQKSNKARKKVQQLAHDSKEFRNWDHVDRNGVLSRQEVFIYIEGWGANNDPQGLMYSEVSEKYCDELFSRFDFNKNDSLEPEEWGFLDVFFKKAPLAKLLQARDEWQLHHHRHGGTSHAAIGDGEAANMKAEEESKPNVRIRNKIMD